MATAREVGGSVWGRLFPFLLVMMSLTGAFYPAIDICAGEKERGTMETLLISPASRTEIVLGKFFTVMLASVMTALLNLVSMGLTGLQMASRVGAIRRHGRAGRAVSAGARAADVPGGVLDDPAADPPGGLLQRGLPGAGGAGPEHEGRPVLHDAALPGQPAPGLPDPLPGVELNLFYSLVPITGVALLLRALILGNYDVAFRYFLPVMVPTVVYAAVALRWAIDQFQREDVLFREAERFSLSSGCGTCTAIASRRRPAARRPCASP